jgi:hypothetical protein
MDLLAGKNNGAFGHISAASWTSCSSAQNVLRGSGIATGQFIENTVEGYFRTVAALVATADHALCSSSQILTDELDSHVLNWRIEVIRAGRGFNRIHVVSESNQSIFAHDIETGRAFRRFRRHDVCGARIRGRFLQQPFEWRHCEWVTFFAGNQAILRF